MEHFQQVFSAFDTFSVTFNPSLDPNTKRTFYKSIFGGIVTIIICTIGIIYSLNLLLKWFNNEMIMKVSTQQEHSLKDSYKYLFHSFDLISYFEIEVFSNLEDDQMIDPFKENEIIILPLLINVTSAKLSGLLNFHNQTSKSLQIQFNDSFYENSYIIIFVSCLDNQQFLTKGQVCANKQQVEDFFQLTGLEIYTLKNYENIDLYTKIKSTAQLYSSQFLDRSYSYSQSISAEYSYTEIRSGMFQNNEQYLQIHSYKETTDIASAGYLDTYFDFLLEDKSIVFNHVFGAICLTQGITVNHIIAEYPTINEVFANIGSTIQVMLLVKYFFFVFNRWRMVEDFKLKCLELYFPQIKQVTQRGRGKKARYFLDQFELEQKSYIEFKRYVNKMFEEKLCYFNLLYELSRIEILVSDIIPLNSLQLCIQKKAALNLSIDKKSGYYKVLNNAKSCNSDLNADVLDPEFDPFRFNYSRSQAKQQMLKSKATMEQQEKDQQQIKIEGKDRDKTKSSINGLQYQSEELFSNIELQIEVEQWQQQIPVSP